MAGLMGKCPRCGQGKLFHGFLTVAARCKVCGLSFRGHDSGDGPAVFVIFILGFGVTGAAVLVEYLYAPPLWVHAVLWIPATLAVTLGLLRPLKGLLVAMQYRNRAAEGRLDQRGPP